MKIPMKNKKVVKIGHSYFMLVPADYINNGLISTDSVYDVDAEFKEKLKDNNALYGFSSRCRELYRVLLYELKAFRFAKRVQNGIFE